MNIYTWIPSYPLIKTPMFYTKIIDYKTGTEQRIKKRENVKFKFSLQHSHIDQEEAEEIIDFYIGQRGSYEPFLFKDLSLSTSSLQIGAGDGSTTEFQLKHDFNNYSKTITHIDSSTFQVWKDNVLQSSPTDFTLNSSGIVDFVSAPASGAVINSSFEFYYIVRFRTDEINHEYFLHQLFNNGNVEFIEV